jgi:hypothetical protein
MMMICSIPMIWKLVIRCVQDGSVHVTKLGATTNEKRYPNVDVVVGLVWSHDPKSYAGGSVCNW